MVIKDYQKAAIVTQLKGWFPSTNNTDLERSQIPGDNLYNFILANCFSKISQSSLLPTIKAAIAT